MAHTTVLMWGSLFCLLAAWCMGKDKNYNREKKRWMLHMQLFTALFLSSEAFAWAFDGRPGKTAWWMVRISNFLLFLTSDLVLVFFNWYVGCHLMPPEERKQNKRYRLVSYIGFFAAFLVVVSQFTHLYYTIDETNLYHRTSTCLLAMVLPASGMLLDFTLLVQYRKRIRRRDFLFMSSYIILPTLAALVQFFHYEASLVSIAISFSMVLIYVAAMEEQSEELEKMSKSKAQTEERLEIATILNRCVKALSSSVNVDKAIHHAKEADLIIYVIDASTNLDENDDKILKIIEEKKTIILLNKSDLDMMIRKEDIEHILPGKASVPIIEISARSKKGILEFEDTLKEMFYKGDLSFNNEIYITNVRQKTALQDAYESLIRVKESIENGMPEDFYSIDLMDAYEFLGSITGETVGEDLIDEIFSKFCMGK